MLSCEGVVYHARGGITMLGAVVSCEGVCSYARGYGIVFHTEGVCYLVRGCVIM